MANTITIQLVSQTEGAVVFSDAAGQVGSMPIAPLETCIEQAIGAQVAVELGANPLQQAGYDFAQPKI